MFQHFAKRLYMCAAPVRDSMLLSFTPRTEYTNCFSKPARYFAKPADQSSNQTLTHVDQSGKAKMVDVGCKPVTSRSATAQARVLIGTEAFELVSQNKIKKGDVLTVANIAGIMGAKLTNQIIPLCHQVALSKVDVQCTLDKDEEAVIITAIAQANDRTGVEMEALVAASVAALTVYDMCKGVNKGIVITDVKLIHKVGGQRGEYIAPQV